MKIDWVALTVVATVSLAVGVLIVVLVSVALVGLSSRELGRTSAAAGKTSVSRLSPAAGTVIASLCLLGASSIVLFGFYLLVF